MEISTEERARREGQWRRYLNAFPEIYKLQPAHALTHIQGLRETEFAYLIEEMGVEVPTIRVRTRPAA